MAAITLDGKIAAYKKQFTDWTSKEDKAWLQKFLAGCDVVIVGRNTYQAAKKPLSKRNCVVLTRSVTGAVRKKKNLIYCNPQKINIKKLIKGLGCRLVAILGGAQTYTYFLENGLLDELYLTIEPVVFGRGLPLFDGKLVNQKPKIVSIKRLNKIGALLVHMVFRNL